MAKNMISVEIKRLPVEVSIPELGELEIADLAKQVEQEMMRLQEEENIIDTLKQAMTAALIFAARAYVKSVVQGGKQKEDESRADQLIAKLKNALAETQKA